MAVADKLKEQGWHLSTEGIQQIDENGSITDVKILIRKALDCDLREISVASFPEDRAKLEFLPGKIVVQIQKIRNVSAPKVNEESRTAPRMLKLSLTDGQSVCQAIEVDSIPSLSLNTPPGSKLYLKAENLPMAHGMILLKPSHIHVLGGKVAHLLEKWELNRSLAKHTRGRIGEEGGPPPWIPFGQKILRSNPNDRNFKSLESSKDKENRENAEFEALRKDAIAEAARGGAKKVFGGGNKPLLDHNVQQIVDYGYSLDQAESALRQNRNIVDKALKSLQRRDEGSRREERPRSESKGKGGEERERRKRGDREDETGAPPKPMASVSLFDFLQNKLPVQAVKESDPQNMGGAGGGGYRGSERKHQSDGTSRGGSSSRGGFSHPRGGGRGPSRGGRGGSRGCGQSQSWSDNRDRDRGSTNSYNNNNNIGSSSGHRDDRGGRHNFQSGSSAPQQQQQKPPRFQNQHRYQQQQQQQHSDNSFGQQWCNSYNDAPSYSNNWGGRGTIQGSSKPGRDDYHNEGYYGDSRRPAKQETMGVFSNNYDSEGKNVRRYDKRSNLGQEVPAALNKYSNLPPQTPSMSYPPPQQRPQQQPQQQTNHLYPLDYHYKEPPPSSNTPTSVYGGSVFPPSHGGYGSVVAPEPVPQFVPDSSSSKAWQWHKGDKCMAKYWEDNMYYNAEVTGVSERTCVVRFVEYGNFEEVLQDDCLPFAEDGLGHNIQSSSAFANHSSDTQQTYNHNHFSGILEFRRGGTRPYIKSSGGDGMGNRDRKPPRIQQQMYVPPAQRKSTHHE